MTEGTERLRALRERIRLFRGCTLDEIRRLLKHATTRFLYDAQLIFREGAPADILFVIISGGVCVSQGDGDAALATLGPGMTVGEMAFIEQRGRSARGVAMGDTVVLEFRRAMLGILDPPLLEKLLRNLFATLASRLRSANTRRPMGAQPGPDLSGADLRGAKMNRSVLTGVVAHDIDLRGADLRGADLRGADLRGAQLAGADLRAVDLTGIIDDQATPPLEVSCRTLEDCDAEASWADLDGPTRRLRRIRAAAKLTTL
jgi:CRP-like cAMP-binding protein